MDDEDVKESSDSASDDESPLGPMAGGEPMDVDVALGETGSRNDNKGVRQLDRAQEERDDQKEGWES